MIAMIKPVRIALDAMGGDHGPEVIVPGAARALRRRLLLFGTPRSDWSLNDYNLGTTMEDAPLANLIAALGSWRCILPRLAFNTIVGTFLQHGASVTVLGTCYLGGERSDVEPVVPTAL